MKKSNDKNQLDLDDIAIGTLQQPQKLNENLVRCLGLTFKDDKERRIYFLGKLKEKLLDPDFKKLEGFPIERMKTF